jgi:Tfp pilus assembly protein FimT
MFDVGCSMLDVPKRKPSSRAFSLIEVMVYLSVLMVVLAVGYAAMYRSMDNSRALRRSTDDIANALHAGENWRGGVGGARGRIQFRTNDTEQILRLPARRGEVSYRFATNTVFRRIGNNDWSFVLGNVAASSFVSDPRQNVAAWRWELELQTRTKQPGRVRPLFTFIAVPTGDSAK